MPTIVTYTPLGSPHRTAVSGEGRSITHHCKDGNGRSHRQRFPLGSVRGVFYVDALCLHCGAHLVWVEDDAAPTTDERAGDRAFETPSASANGEGKPGTKH